MTNVKVLIKSALITLLINSSGYTFPGGGMGGPGGGDMGGFGFGNSGAMAEYDSSSFITIDVAVDSVGENESNPEGGTGLHLYTSTSDGDRYTIHVAPQFYIDEKNITFSAGESLKVSGSRFSGGPKGGNNIYAATIVRKNSDVAMQFRDAETGTGVWQQYMKSKMQNQMRNKMRSQMQDQMRRKMQNRMQQGMQKENSMRMPFQNFPQ